MKKILLSAAAIAALGTSGAHADTGNVGGFYAGLAAGVANNYLDWKNGTEAPVAGNDSNRDLKFGASSAIFNLYIGYGKLWGNFYGGLELNGGINTLLLKGAFLQDSGLYSPNYKYSSPWHAGASLRLGRSLFSSQALVYLGLGVQCERHELKFNNLSGTLGSNFRKKFTTTHFVPSVGVEGMITERMTMRFQVDYNCPAKVKTFTAPSATSPSNNRFNQKIHVSSVVAKIGIGYKF